jgi:uncharacterized membrane protein YraQ (UPF0718 family)
MKKLLEDYMIECVICIIAIILIIFNPHKVAMGLTYAVNMYVNLFLIIVSVAFLSGFISEAVPPNTIGRIIGKDSGWKGILIGAIFGTFMVGPTYVFYPLFRNLIDKGAGINVIATTIGAWAIKVQWIPFAIVLLGWKFTLIFNLLIFLFAIASGFVVAFFSEKDY